MFKNTFKTFVLLAALAGLAVVIGGAVAGRAGLLIGLGLGLALVGGSYWFSDRIALRAAGATVVGPAEQPALHAMVARLADRAGLPMPTVAVSPAMQPNAFATGRGPRKAVVAVTQGLLDLMPADELEGVLAHELMHVRNRDILIGSIAAAIATGISYIAQMAFFSSLFTGGDEDAPNPIALLLFTLIAPLAAMLIQLAVSRSREFEADRSAAELLGTGEPLARALERIEGYAARMPMEVSPAQASAWIHDPLGDAPRSAAAQARARQTAGVTKLFRTHPETTDRIARLRDFDRSRGLRT